MVHAAVGYGHGKPFWREKTSRRGCAEYVRQDQLRRTRAAIVRIRLMAQTTGVLAKASWISRRQSRNAKYRMRQQGRRGLKTPAPFRPAR